MYTYMYAYRYIYIYYIYIIYIGLHRYIRVHTSLVPVLMMIAFANLDLSVGLIAGGNSRDIL